MNFEDMQKNWQEHTKGASITIDTEILLKEVRRNKQYFDAMIFWRDVREIGVAFVMIILFTFWTIRDKVPSLIFPAIGCLFIGAYMLIDRFRLKKKHPNPKHSNCLREIIECSLGHINHQIWLLKNVFWWYLLPVIIGVSIFWGRIGWDVRDSLLWSLFIVGCFVFLFVVCFGVYHLNQYAIRKDLKPRKDELEELLKSIESAENGQS